MTFSYSITLSSFLNIQKNEIETLENLTQLGLTEVELYGEPDNMNWDHLKDLLNSFEIKVIGITGCGAGQVQMDGKGVSRVLINRYLNILKIMC